MATYTRVIQGGKDFLKPKKWENWAIGDFVEGVFEDCKELDKFGKPIYEIKVTNKQITGADPTITSGDKKGIMPLYPNGSLIMQMSLASLGDKVRIEYKGEAEVTKGKWKGTKCHNVEVGIEGYQHEEESEGDTDSLLG